MAKWTGRIEAIKNDLKYWQAHIEELWKSPALIQAGISLPTRHFVETWLSFVLVSPGHQKLPDYRPAEKAIFERERALKRSRARLENPRALELWRGSSGTQQLSFRWPVASTFVEDILKGIREGKTDA